MSNEKDENTQNYFIRNEYGTKCYLTKHSKIIASKFNELIEKLLAKGHENIDAIVDLVNVYYLYD